MFEKRGLRTIFGPKRDEVTGGGRKLHIEKLRNLYSSLSIIRMIKSRRMRWEGHVTRMGRSGMHIRYWWESQKRRRWLDNIKMDLREIGWGDIVWIDLARDRDQ
jgi:hypothetical protein